MTIRSVRIKILGSLILVTMLFGVGMIVFAETFMHRILHDMLRDKGVAVAKRVAMECVNPVITERYFEITLMFKDLLAGEPDIVYAYVLDESGLAVAHTFAGGIPRELVRAHKAESGLTFSAKDLATDKGRVHDIAVPLMHGQIGVLHLGLANEAIDRDVNDIIRVIIIFSLFVLIVGVAVSVGISRVITRPLSMLSQAAESFGQGEMAGAVAIDSKDEIGDLAKVFNSMIEKRKLAEKEREILITDLQKALAEIKTLQGTIPICASCKKIRDEEGAWHQLEAYISAHTDSTFTHGICKDCAKKLYPEFTEHITNP